MYQDLIKEDRLAKAGGRLVFSELAVQIVAYAVDREVVRVVVAGSSAALRLEFGTTVARGNRWDYTRLGDPPEDAVLERLQQVGYSAEDARAMVTLCGTRLRLLNHALKQGQARLPAAVFMDKMEEAAVGEFHAVFHQLSPKDCAKLSSVLDAICSRPTVPPARSWWGFLRHDGNRVFGPTLRDLPRSCYLVRHNGNSIESSHHRAVDVSTVLFLNIAYGLTFQSILHRNIWTKYRTKLFDRHELTSPTAAAYET